MDLYMSILVFFTSSRRSPQSSTTTKAHQDTQIVDIDLQKHNDWSETGKCTCTLLLDFRKYPMHREHISILCKPIHGKHVRSTDLAFYTSTPSDLDDCWTHKCITCLFTCSCVSSNFVRFPTQSDSKRAPKPSHFA